MEHQGRPPDQRSAQHQWLVEYARNQQPGSRPFAWTGFRSKAALTTRPTGRSSCASTTIGSSHPTTSLQVTYGNTRLRQYFDNDSVGEGWPQKLGLKGVSEGDTNAFPVVTVYGRTLS